MTLRLASSAWGETIAQIDILHALKDVDPCYVQAVA